MSELDPMSELEQAIGQWLATVTAEEPSLAAHADELADHLRSAAEVEIEDGAEPLAALAKAIEGLGLPVELAREFTRARGLRSKIACALAGDRGDLGVAGAWILLSLGWAAAMIVVEGDVIWMTVGWTATTYLPLTALTAWRQRTRTSRPRRI